MSNITGDIRRDKPVLYGTASYFATNANFQPVMNNHFEIYIMGLNNDVFSHGEVFTGNNTFAKTVSAAGQITEGDLGEILRLNVSSFKIPEITVQSIDIRHGNDRVKLAGQPSVGDCSITVHDVIGADTQRVLWAWFNLVFDVEKKTMGINVDYKKNAILYQFAPDGSTVRSWDCRGLWPTSFPGNDFAYDRSQNIDLQVTLACDTMFLIRGTERDPIPVQNETNYQDFKQDYEKESPTEGQG